MPSTMQRIRMGRERYKGSPIETRNLALRRAAQLQPFLISARNSVVSRLVDAGYVLTALDYCSNGELSGRQIDMGREPHLLAPDPYNPGELRVEPIYDSRVDFLEGKTGKCWVDVHAGEVLVDGSTAVYWR